MLFYVENARVDCQFALVNGGSQFPLVAGLSNPIKFKSPSIPLGVRRLFFYINFFSFFFFFFRQKKYKAWRHQWYATMGRSIPFSISALRSARRPPLPSLCMLTTTFEFWWRQYIKKGPDGHGGKRRWIWNCGDHIPKSVLERQVLYHNPNHDPNPDPKSTSSCWVFWNSKFFFRHSISQQRWAERPPPSPPS